MVSLVLYISMDVLLCLGCVLDVARGEWFEMVKVESFNISAQEGGGAAITVDGTSTNLVVDCLSKPREWEQTGMSALSRTPREKCCCCCSAPLTYPQWNQWRGVPRTMTAILAITTTINGIAMCRSQTKTSNWEAIMHPRTWRICRKGVEKLGKEVKEVRRYQRVGCSPEQFAKYNMRRRKKENVGRKLKQKL